MYITSNYIQGSYDFNPISCMSLFERMCYDLFSFLTRREEGKTRFVVRFTRWNNGYFNYTMRCYNEYDTLLWEYNRVKLDRSYEEIINEKENVEWYRQSENIIDDGFFGIYHWEKGEELFNMLEEFYLDE